MEVPSRLTEKSPTTFSSLVRPATEQGPQPIHRSRDIQQTAEAVADSRALSQHTRPRSVAARRQATSHRSRSRSSDFLTFTAGRTRHLLRCRVR